MPRLSSSYIPPLGSTISGNKKWPPAFVQPETAFPRFHSQTSPKTPRPHFDANLDRQVVFKYTEALALDLRVFAKHGKRAVVGVDDVKCVARKDPKMVRVPASSVEFNFMWG